MQKSGAGFAGFATWLDMTPAHPDLFVIPDPQSVIPLPWKPGVAWVAGDPWMDGKPVAQAPRLVLKSLMDKAASRGMTLLRRMTHREGRIALYAFSASATSFIA